MGLEVGCAARGRGDTQQLPFSFMSPSSDSPEGPRGRGSLLQQLQHSALPLGIVAFSLLTLPWVPHLLSSDCPIPTCQPQDQLAQLLLLCHSYSILGHNQHLKH